MRAPRSTMTLLFALLGGLAVAIATAAAQTEEVDPYLGIPVGGGPIDAGPVPAGIDAIDAASCGACHEQHAREWAASAHRTAFTNAIFQAEFEPHRRPYCQRCHAPRGEPSAGVDCAVCHVRDGAVLNPTISGRAPHAGRVAPLDGTLACARCHDFAFESQPDLGLQRTVQEWVGSRHHDTLCQGCHMPRRGRARSHRFPGGLDPGLLEHAIRVEARAVSEGSRTRLTLTMSTDAAGHAVPTGDIFRRLEVRAFAAEDNAARPVVLARRFQRAPAPHGGMQRLQVGDDRLPASGAPVEVELFFLRPPVPPIRWEVAYQRMGPSEAAVFGVDLSADETIVASGRIEPER
ncbi:MAG: hypothetical protein KDB94_10955 [Acidobacteria bacterium]|nr:hypothetical protein [Acidobacteriota bacterium]